MNTTKIINGVQNNLSLNPNSSKSATIHIKWLGNIEVLEYWSDGFLIFYTTPTLQHSKVPLAVFSHHEEGINIHHDFDVLTADFGPVFKYQLVQIPVQGPCFQTL